MEMRFHFGIRFSDRADRLTLHDLRPLGDGDPAKRAVDRVVVSAVLDHDRAAVRRQTLVDEGDDARRDGLHRRSLRRGDTDAVPPPRWCVRVPGPPEQEDGVPLPRPVEPAEIGGLQRAVRGEVAAAASLGALAFDLEQGDDVAEACLFPRDLREAALGLLLLRLRLREASRALLVERAQPFLFVCFLLPRTLDVAAQRPQRLALVADLLAERLHAVHQRAVALRGEVQVLVARHQLAERLRREHGFDRIQRSAFVDLAHAVAQHRALDREFVLRADQVRGGVVLLVGEGVELFVERVHDARRRVGLARDVRALLGEVVHGGLQLAHAALQAGALETDLFELVFLCLEAFGGVLLRGLGRRGLLGANALRIEQRDRERDGEQCRAAVLHYTSRKCRPTENALPSRPISAPAATPATAYFVSKNSALNTNFPISELASHVSSSASSPPSVPLSRPSIRNGLRMNPSVAPTTRMIEISRDRASTAMRIVDPMMITATPAKARPSTAPAIVAMLRMR